MSLSARIIIEGPKAKLEGDYPIGDMRELMSYPVAGYEFSEAYQKTRH